MTAAVLMMALTMMVGAATMILTVMMVGEHVDKQLVVKMQVVVVKTLGAVKLGTLKQLAVVKTRTLAAVKILAAAARMVVLTIKAAATTRRMIASKLAG